MSLQPLDTTNDIPDAYKLALSESRRWLLLAYTSRSALELRAQGIGLPDLRKQLEEEEEVLFGFLRFRRRGIVLQYTNPDCSRVVKARAQVHLQTILNFFRDNDFLLETSTPKDITLDNIARLTNSTSTSTINSSKKSKRLTDIMEESPIILGDDEEDDQSSPASSEANSMTDSPKPPEGEGEQLQQPPLLSTSPFPPRNKLLLKPFIPEMSLASPPATPRSPLPPSPLRRTPSPSETTNHTSTEYQQDSYSSPLPSPVKPTPPPVNAPPTPPTPPEKLRLLKALEIRRQKLSGKTVVVIPKIIEAPPAKRTIDEMTSPPTPPIPLVIKPPSPENKARLIQAKKAAMEEHRRHLSSLEATGRDLLCGWVNFQSSTSLLWRRKFIRINASRELILSETEDSLAPSTVDKATWRWKINQDVRGVEIPDRDEEQLPNSLRIAAERGGAVFSIACQTHEDLINLRRGNFPPWKILIGVLGYCLNDEGVFSG